MSITPQKLKRDKLCNHSLYISIYDFFEREVRIAAGDTRSTQSPTIASDDSDNSDNIFSGSKRMYAKKYEPEIYLNDFPPEHKDVSELTFFLYITLHYLPISSLIPMNGGARIRPSSHIWLLWLGGILLFRPHLPPLSVFFQLVKIYSPKRGIDCSHPLFGRLFS